MNNKTKILMAGVVLFTWFGLVGRVEAATYYVRPDGGTATQCNGTVDAPYLGTGINQPCAFNHPFWAIAPIGNNPTKLAGGDTLIIDGSNNTQYKIGFGAPNTNDTSKCASYYPWECYMRPIPSGPDPAHPTRVLGKGWNTGCSSPPQLWGTERVKHVLNLQGSDNIELQCLEITDHSNCQEHGPNPCNRSSFPFGPWATTGLWANDSENVLLKNVNIHGLAYKGVHAGRLRDWTIEDSKIIANSFVGWDGDIGSDSSNSGTLTFTNTKILFNGCGETYPGLQPYNCYSQDQGGYGDGIGTYYTAGHWVFNNVDISHNVSDGLDLLYHDGNGSVTIKRSRFEGNAGNQLKTKAETVIENSIIIGNCGYFANQSFTWNPSTFNNCRAYGNPIALMFHPGRHAKIVNSTITANANVIVMSKGSSCNGTEYIDSKNNIYLGGTNWFNHDEKSTLYYAAGSDGNGAGSCAQIPFNDDYSVIYNTKNFSTDCNNKPHSICGNPLLVDSAQFYAGNAYNVNLQSESPARNNALIITGMSSLDYNHFDRGSVWDRGALEYGSVPVTGPAICGNSIVEALEQCDDGNTNSGDGCSSTCTIEVLPVCGNGILEGNEACDDGNLINGDGCNAICQIELPAVCGNGVIELNEQCDDGNLNNGDGCSSLCQNELLPACGNGLVELGEQCDDGNTSNGDGCSSTCQNEPPPVCGNGILQNGEQCDDGNTTNWDGCSSTCQIEVPICGNGHVQTGEQCDDGNTANGDGCSSICQTEVLICGNGIVEGYEQCDDGNTTNGDGCSSTCTIEQVNYQLKLSYSSNRSGAVVIPSQINASDVYIFVSPTTLIKQVKFYLDGSYIRTENYPEYDFGGTNGDGSAAPFNAASLSSETTHTIRADIVRQDNLTQTISRSFTVTSTPSSVTIEAEDFANKPGAPIGGSISNGWKLWRNGEMSTPVDLSASGQYRLKIVAKGDLAGSETPKMRIKINGSSVTTISVGSKSWKTYSVNVNITQSSNTIAIEYINDYYAPNADRNLMIDKVTFDPRF